MKIEYNYFLINNPKFEEATRVHDWRNYVPDEFIKNWNELSLRERQIIIDMAENQASSEVWD